MPRLEGLVIDDAFAERLFRALGIEPSAVADPVARRRALGRLVLTALEDMLARLEARPEIDRDELARQLALVAGGARVPEASPDTWGVPVRFWTADRQWHEPADADRWTREAEAAISILADLGDRRVGRTALLVDRLMPTGAERTAGLVLRPPGEVSVVVRVADEMLRLRFAAGTGFAGGILSSDPEPVNDRR